MEKGAAKVAVESSELHRTLGPLMLWGLGVGYVISGMYFGWNLGLAEGGPFGFLAATLVVTLMYVAFVLSYSELACMMPRSGGAFVYATRALGPKAGLVTGIAQLIEFVFAPPAIAAAIGAYVTLFLPSLNPMVVAVAAYILFTALNIWGVKQSAIFELVIAVIAVAELLIFAGVAGGSFTFEKFSKNPLPHGWWGAFAAIPYAIWFYLAIEGVANVAEEAKNPQKDLSWGFSSSMATLVVLALLTLFASVGVQGWEAVVFKPGTVTPSDSPLPLALAHVVGEGHVMYHLLIGIGVFGLIASFHGIILVAGRATFELGRSGFAPAILGNVHSTRKTPAWALLFNLVLGCVALASGKTGEIIILAVFGALTLYIVSMTSLLKLRKTEPETARPYRVPLFPYVPLTALVLAVICAVSMVVSQPTLAAVYAVLLGASYFGLGRFAAAKK